MNEEELTFTTLRVGVSVCMCVYMPAHQAPEGRDSIHFYFVFLTMSSTVPDTEEMLKLMSVELCLLHLKGIKQSWKVWGEEEVNNEGLGVDEIYSFNCSGLRDL